VKRNAAKAKENKTIPPNRNAVTNRARLVSKVMINTPSRK